MKTKTYLAIRNLDSTDRACYECRQGIEQGQNYVAVYEYWDEQWLGRHDFCLECAEDKKIKVDQEGEYDGALLRP